MENYKTLLPQSWQTHGQARIPLYVRDDINLKVKPLARENTDLPSVSWEIGVGREKKTRINFFYSIWTSRVSGLGDNDSQVWRLKRQINHWKTLHAGGRDTIILGDANLCALKWEEEDFQYKELALQDQESLKDFKLPNAKRTLKSGINSRRRNISNLYRPLHTNVPEKIKSVQVMSAGNSDHLGIVIKKFTKFPVYFFSYF